MPWPFRKRKEEATGPAAPSPAPTAPATLGSAGRPITAADFAPARLAVPVPRAWAALPPMAPTITPAAHGLVVPAASFVSDVAGTQTLIQSPALRQVSADGPAGRADGVVAGERSLVGTPRESGPAPAGSAQVPGSSARPLSAQARRDATGRFDRYEGPLEPVESWRSEADWDAGWYDDDGEPEDDGGIPEELPPPIFSAILAERRGVPLSDLRPDLAGGDADAEPAGPATPPRKRSLAESRRVGLGAPQHSASAEGEGPAPLPEDFDPAAVAALAAAAAAELAAQAAALQDPDVELVEEELSFEELAALRPFGGAPLPDEEPEPPGPARPTLRFRSAPGAPVRRFPSTGGIPLRQEVPGDVRDAVQRATGVDPGPTEVRRGPEASAEATRIGAVAFTRDGEMFLPAEHGALDMPATRAVLAHELTHVVQQRVYGDRLPRRASAGGQALEAQAGAVQNWVGGTGPAPARRPQAGQPAVSADVRELRETADELVASGLAHWAPDGTLVFGGGTGVGGRGEDWLLDVAGNPEVAQREGRELLDRIHHLAEDDPERAKLSLEYTEFQKQFEEMHGSSIGTAGTGAGAGGGKSAKELQAQLDQLNAEAAQSGPMSYGDMSKMLFAGSTFGDPRGELGADEKTTASSLFGGSVFGDPRDAEYAQEQKDYAKSRTELKAKLDKAREAETAAKSLKAGEAAPALAGAALVHKPAGGDATAKPPGGDTAGAKPGVDAAKEAKILQESDVIAQQMKAQQDMWKLQDEMAKLEAEKPIDMGVYSYEDMLGGGGKGHDPFGGAFSGGAGGFFSALGGGLFGDPRDAEAAQEKAAYEEQKKRLEIQIKQTQALEAAKEKEAKETLAKQAAAKDAKEADAKKATDAGDKKAGEPAAAKTLAAPGAAADLTAGRTAGSGSSDTEGAGADILDQLDDDDIEELAGLLYGRLVTRLRRELIVDRERAGLLSDFR